MKDREGGSSAYAESILGSAASAANFFRDNPIGLDPSIYNIPAPPPKMSADEQREWFGRQVEAAEVTNGQVRELVNLTVANVELARESQDAAARTEGFARRIGWASLVISVASFIAATLAIVLQALELQQG